MSENLIQKIKIQNVEYDLGTTIDNVSGLQDVLAAKQPVGDYALKSDIPTDYLKAIPEEYVTESELSAKGYLTSFTESDPTVPAWAKAATKPTYTAAEVGALPADTVIPTVPTNVSAFANDAGYITEHQSLEGLATESYVNTQIAAIPKTDLTNYYTKDETNTVVDNKIKDAAYTLPEATQDTLGGVKVGDGLKIANGVISADVVDNLTSTSTTQALSAAQGKVLSEAINSITTDLGNLGGGDMLKATYDKDDDGVVDNAAKLDGHDASYFATSSDFNTLVGNKKVSEQITEAINNIDYPVDSVNGKTGTVVLTAVDVGALPSSTVIPSIAGLATENYVNAQIAAIPTPDVSGQINTHNTATDAHNDIRLLVEGLSTRLNALADSDDTTLDQMSEIVAYIKSNKGLIDGITTSKINVSDIIDNLTTNASNKPLSAAQGVALKALIDAITVPTKVSELTNDSGYLSSIPSEYVTETELNAKGYLTEHQSLEGYAKTADLGDLATKDSLTASEVGALPLSGGTMTGEIKIGQGDGKGIQLGTNGRINATVGSNTAATMFGISNGIYYLGHSGFATTIRGSQTRPTYNGNDMALSSDVTSLSSEIGKKVDKVDGKGLSTNDFTDEYKTKLDGLENITFEETDPTVPAWAKQPNKPTYTAAEVGALPADTYIPSIEGLESYINNTVTDKIVGKQDTITGTAGQFVVIGADGKPTTKAIPYAEEATF